MNIQPVPDDPKEYGQYMQKEIVGFAKMIVKYKNEIARLYGQAKTDFEKATKFSKQYTKDANKLREMLDEQKYIM